MLHLDPLVHLELPCLELLELRASLEPPGFLAVMEQRERLSIIMEALVTMGPPGPLEQPVLRETKVDLVTQAHLARKVKTELELPVTLELRVQKETLD